MNRVTRGTVVLAVALAALSCKGDPTDSLRNGVDHLVATPSALYINNGETRTVLVEAVDEQGNRQGTSFNFGTVGAGITVVEDDSFNLVFDKKGNQVQPKSWPRVQYEVTADGYVSSSFVVSAGGKSLTIPVRTFPVNLASAIANPTPAIGELVTLTAPAGLSFDPATTTVSFAPGGTAVITAITATDVTFIPIPGSQGVATVTGIIPTYAPIGPFTLQTTDVLNVAAVTSIPAVYSPANPNTNDLVTITAVGFKFLPSVTVRFDSDAQLVTAVAADSSSVTIRAGKSGTPGSVTIGNTVLSVLTSVPLSVPAVAQPTVSATITPLAGTGTIPTAPTVLIPPTGQTHTIRDAGPFFNDAVCTGILGGPCRYYKFTITTARSFAVSATWQGITDLGVYFLTAANGVTGTTGCDAKGAGAGGQPESCTVTSLPAGTYTIVVDDFSPFYGPPNNVPPTDFTVTITGN